MYPLKRIILCDLDVCCGPYGIKSHNLNTNLGKISGRIEVP
jgi:hypothetical protein